MRQHWLWYGWALIAAFAWSLGGDQNPMIHRCLAASTETPTELWRAGWLESLGGRTWWDAGCWRLSWLHRLAVVFGWDVLWGGIGLSVLLLCVGWKLCRFGSKETLAIVLCASCFVAVAVGYGSSDGMELFAWGVLVVGVIWRYSPKERDLGSLLLGVVLLFPLSVGRWWVILAVGWAGCVLCLHPAQDPTSGSIQDTQESTEGGQISAVRWSVLWSGVGGLCLGLLLSGWGWWRAWSQQQALQGIPVVRVQKRQAHGGAVGGDLHVAQEQTTLTHTQENPTKRFRREQARWGQLLRLLRSLRAQEGESMFRMILLHENLLPWGWEGHLEIGALRIEGGAIAPHVLRMIHLIQTGRIAARQHAHPIDSSQTTQHAHPIDSSQTTPNAHPIDSSQTTPNAHPIGSSWDRIARWDLLHRWGVHWLLSPYAIRLPKGRFVFLRSIRIEDQRWWLYRRPFRPMESWPLRRVYCANDEAALWKNIAARSLATDEAWVLGCHATHPPPSANTTQPSLTQQKARDNATIATCPKARDNATIATRPKAHCNARDKQSKRHRDANHRDMAFCVAGVASGMERERSAWCHLSCAFV